MIKVIKVEIEKDKEAGEPSVIYELNDGQRLFDFIAANFDIGDKVNLELIEMTDDDFKLAQEIGEQLA